MKIILIVLLTSLSCKNSKDRNEILALLNLPTTKNSTQVFFSYPGRYEDEMKKRNVLVQVLKLIKETKTRLDIYAYSFNNREIIDELLLAKKRGVEINFILDSEQDYSLLKEEKFTIRIWKSSGLYHMKIIYSDFKTVFFGTGNFSRHGLTHDWNGFIQMEVGQNEKQKLKDFFDETYTEPILYLNEMHFINSPDYGLLTQDRILTEVKNAKQSIRYLTFDHTDALLSNALKEASARGVEVTGIYDSPVDGEGVYLNEEFYGLNSAIYRDGNEDRVQLSSFPEGGLLHHKTILIDENKLITGSYNFSSNARDRNREFMMFTKNAILVSEFEKEFERIKDKSYRLIKTKFNTKQEIILLNEESLDDDKINLPSFVNQPLIEINDFTKTSLYFSKTIQSKQILFKDYVSISSGVSFSGVHDFLSSSPFDENFKIYDRDTNRIFLYQNKINSAFKDLANPIPLEVDYMGFNLKNDLIFRTKESIDFSNADYSIWIPKSGTFSGRLSKYSEESFYQGSIPIPLNRRNYFMMTIKSNSKNYFLCYREAKYRDKGKEFIHQKIFADIFFHNPKAKFQSCYTPI